MKFEEYKRRPHFTTKRVNYVFFFPIVKQAQKLELTNSTIVAHWKMINNLVASLWYQKLDDLHLGYPNDLHLRQPKVPHSQMPTKQPDLYLPANTHILISDS